ncbi:MiaB/RimO family radical SAM methylthiotransferase [Candidatus Cryosericum hinesii]|jgi:threonylcarbamoyladenosine tRNA methylthiotransferase MtaB|uniref:MiaB/RimO family radical SAM methylthiotransferase n=1 Tax=Candidatus Cryosericum hinesii TaxID=2290915 RepID=A0A398DXT7_9BACT|nr:MiaB/RimO family radical SAM methylthiotransferase [Candidatus Cryosericum hinesii]RIE11243.1 MiaB/RimO family radical SAM methylthiotransferase [Candidatus Cryosericum hinesii]RIE15201.1 MiaB/RimO family radical SAM methylthiotransferase [Candidatus Cryosericum hinesii]RIE15731.1 MiaB/RimO family radical SAM methylthiotransferase [Candidatus Cryosericum hinesii]
MKVFIYTLGCKVNEVDSELYAQEMRLLGAETTTTLTEADAVIVNSCSVTNRAQAQSLQFARRALRERPGAPVYLTGCGAALLNLTRTGAPVGVTVVAMGDRAEVARLVVGSGDTVQTAARWVDGCIQRAGPRNRVDVRVQEGCDNMCTYCVVPFVRGARLESKAIDVAVDEVMGLAAAGVKEVVLTGTEIGKYGRTPLALEEHAREEVPDMLPVLLDSMLWALEAAGLPTRVRVSSLNPDAITEALVSQFANHAALCPQLHLPLQSGSDAVLQRMRRPYASKSLLDSVQRLRADDPSFALTTDVIVGFPGETEQDLQATLDVIRLAAFAKVHVFPYSPRPFTPAAREDHQVSAGVAKDRLHRVLEAAEQTGMAFARRFIGRDVTIVSEKSSLGEVEGYSEHYLWTEGHVCGNKMLERDNFVVVHVEGCHFDGDRVVLSGSAAT